MLGLIGGVLGGLISARQNRYNVDKTINANRQLAEYQYSRDLEMWKRQNEYNSPSSQMARLKEAGLNPNLVYGQGARGATGQATEMPKYQAPRESYDYQPVVDLPSVLSQFQDFQIKQAQHDNLEAQRKVIEETGVQKQLTNEMLPDRLFLQNEDRYIRNYWNNFLYRNKERQQRMDFEFKYDMYPHQKRSQMLKNLAAEQAYSQKSQLFPYQLQGMAERNRKFGAEIEKIIADTEIKKLQTDWFVADRIANYTGKLAQAAGTAAIGKGLAGRLSSHIPKGRKVRYNSPTFWNKGRFTD